LRARRLVGGANPNPPLRKIIVARENDRAAEGENKKTPETNLMIWSLRHGRLSSQAWHEEREDAALFGANAHPLRAVAFAKSEKEPKRAIRRHAFTLVRFVRIFVKGGTIATL